MSCMCGAIDCPSCGPAQGYSGAGERYTVVRDMASLAVRAMGAFDLSAFADLRGRLNLGFWVWVGDWVIHNEGTHFLAIHKTGNAKMKCSSVDEALERFS